MAELSKRQIEILQLSAAGGSAKTIARTLKISVHTVREYIKDARFRLDSQTITEAVAKFERRNLSSSAHR